MAPLHRWKLSALAAATAACLGLQPLSASALTLGRLTVQSALGEPLRAEIEVLQISAAETETLRTQLGSAEQFKVQGLELPSGLNGLQIQLQRRVGGQAVLQLSTDRAVTDPFLDLVLDAQWQNGRLVRSYTLLLDPPALKRSPNTVRLAPQASAAAAPQAPARAAPAPSAAPTVALPTASAPGTRRAVDGVVTVQPGQTATQIANRHRPAGVSLDQMLLALLQGNPQAFIAGDVNRIKAGSPLKLPDPATAQATPSEQARQALTARSSDFHAYRRELAAMAPPAAVAPPGRSATGAIQAKVEEKKAAPTSADKLMLSRSGIGDPGTPEAQLARDKQARDSQARVETLSQNIAVLHQAQGGATPSPSAAPAEAPPATAGNAPQPAPTTATTAGDSSAATRTEPKAAAPAPTDAPVAETPTQAPAAAAAPPKMAAPAGVPASPPASASDPWSNNPLVPFAAGSLSALLLSYGMFRYLQARQARALAAGSFLQTSGVLEQATGPAPGTDVPPQSAAAAAVAATPPPHSTDTALEPTPTPPEHTTAANDSVDPVAEADVYLAYGREQQAEDILSDALRRTPQRTAIHAKLAEIYAMRRDRKALQRLQDEVFPLSQGVGPDWERIVALAQSLEPQASLHTDRTPAAPTAAMVPSEALRPAEAATVNATAATDTAPADAAADKQLPPMEFDFDLAPAPLPSHAAPAAQDAAPPPSAAATAEAPATASNSPPSLLARMELPSLDLVPQAAPAAPAAEPAAATATTPASPQTEAAPAAALELPAALDTSLPAQTPSPLREPETVESAPEGMALDFMPLDAAPSPQVLAAPSQGPFGNELAPPRETRAPLELDLQGLALELDSLGTATTTAETDTDAETADAISPPPPVPEPRLQTTPPTDRLATKLALAAEFKAIGDLEGTRSLLQEVASEATGELQARARQMLAELG